MPLHSKNQKSTLQKIINKPFQRIINSTLKSLQKTNLTPEEKRIIDLSVNDKYVPVLRNAFFFSIIATPTYVQNPEAAYVIFGIITSLTGLAWFSISLKDVKAKFGEFGTELTADMLEAFLTSLFLVALIAVCNTVIEPIQQIDKLIQSSEIKNSILVNISNIFVSIGNAIPYSVLLIIKILVPLGIIFRIVKKLVHATIKHDTNDAMLTGSSDAAQIFFKKATSSLLKAAEILKTEHSLEVANYQIVSGLENYLYGLNDKNIKNPKNISYEEILKLKNQPEIMQRDFDIKIIPMFENCIKQYTPYTQKNIIEKKRTDAILKSLRNLLKLYESDHQPSQNFADSIMAQGLETLADLFDSYNDQLISN